MTWKIIIEKQPRKYISKQSLENREILRNAILKLKNGPYQDDSDISSLKGRPEWRLRVGRWRILFLVNNNEILITVISIKPRGDVYK